jgi:hypothetical protein
VGVRAADGDHLPRRSDAGAGARRLIEAEDALKLRGEAGVMGLHEALGYGPRKGQRLKGIAGNERFAHAAHARHLPTSWMTLHELTRLTEPQWEYGLRTGMALVREVGRAWGAGAGARGRPSVIRASPPSRARG